LQRDISVGLGLVPMPRLARPRRRSAAQEESEGSGDRSSVEVHSGKHRWLSLFHKPNPLTDGTPRPRHTVPLASATLSSHGNPKLSTNQLASSPKQPNTDLLEVLPIYEWQDGVKRQFATRGAKLSTVDPDALTPDTDKIPAVFQRLPRNFRRKLDEAWDSFFPDPNGVSPEYYLYCKWRFLQRIASSSLSVMATQQMLLAVGLGAQRALPTAAAINWVLKDGLGRIGKLSVATQFGRQFDADIKRFRFISSVVYDMSAGVEIMTPLFPKQFLLLATCANIGKSIGVTTANVVRAPIQVSFSLQSNLADIAARTSAQQVVSDNLGLALAVAITAAVRNLPKVRTTLPFVLYPILSGIDLFCIHKELKCVQLKTVNKERGEIIAEHWLQQGEAPSFAEVAKHEHLFLAPSLEDGNLPLLVRPLSEAISSVEALKSVVASTRRAGSSPGKYILFYRAEPVKGGVSLLRRAQRLLLPNRGAAGKRKSRWRGHAVVALHHGYTTEDIMTALLQVAHLRRLPFRKDLTAEQARRWGMEESLTRAQRDLPRFMRDVKARGWQTNKLLLSSTEKVTFCVDGGMEALAKHLNI